VLIVAASRGAQGATAGGARRQSTRIGCQRPRSARSICRRRISVLLAILTTASIGATTASVTAADPYWGPGYASCGRHTYHTSGGGSVALYIAARNTPCRTALRIEHELYTAPGNRLKIVNGGSGATGYILLKRYPGWKCTSGAGAGSCQRGSKFAGYSYRRV
jgi:hypothetical protein